MGRHLDFDRLAARSNELCRQSAELRSRLAMLADAIADTEESVGATMERLAQCHPDRADHLRAMAAEARQFAEHERRECDRWRSPALPRDR